jgi:hypothetical protein
MVSIERETKYEDRYHPNMGVLITRVTRIKLKLFGVLPLKTLHAYRETYNGKIKDLKNCKLNKI